MVLLSVCRQSSPPNCFSCCCVPLSDVEACSFHSLEYHFITFRVHRTCGWRMNEYQGNIVLVCVGCTVGGHVVLWHLLYCFGDLHTGDWNKTKMLILAEICGWMNNQEAAAHCWRRLVREIRAVECSSYVRADRTVVGLTATGGAHKAYFSILYAVFIVLQFR
jgi:hypothetical protein